MRISLITIVIAITVALFAYVSFVFQLGFPDSFISEQDRVRRTLAYVVIAVSVATVFALLVVTFVSTTYQRRLSIAISSLYFLALIAALAYDLTWIRSLPGSGGG
jgi:hypothetical protein